MGHAHAAIVPAVRNPRLAWELSPKRTTSIILLVVGEGPPLVMCLSLP